MQDFRTTRPGAGHGGGEPAAFPATQICLFLDFDGTLVELCEDPRDVRPEARLVELLGALRVAVDGALAIVSGRLIDDLDRMLHPLRLPAAGLHGLERRDAQGRRRLAPAAPAGALHALRPALRQLVTAHPGLYLEDKSASLAVHYRRAPELEERVQRVLEALAARLAPEFELMHGDKVLEIKPASLDKAAAVEGFMREAPFSGRLPVYVGDDFTDCDGFGAVRRHDGMTVAVGDRITAQWRLPDPAAVRAWLARIAATGRRANT